MKIKLSPQQKGLLRQKLIAMFRDDFEEELSDFKADQILDAFIEKLGPSIYNAAIEDILNPLDNFSRWNPRLKLNSRDLQWGGLKQTAT